MTNTKILAAIAAIVVAAFFTWILWPVEKLAPGRTWKEYPEQWAKIDSLKNIRNLPASVLEEVQKLYQQALDEQQYGQVVKAIMYRMECQAALKDKALNKLIGSLKEDLEVVPQPTRSIIYSLIGDVYKNYFQVNRWQIMERTSAAVDQDDIYTWDVNKLFEEALKNYTLSVAGENILQQTPLTDYNILLQWNNEKENKVIYSTLYDFLLNRTIQLLQGEMGIARPQQGFILNNPVYLGDTRTFAGTRLNDNDTLSVNYQVLSLYQKLLRFHLKGMAKARIRNLLGIDSHYDKMETLVFFDVERLKYVYTNGNMAHKDELYEKALKSLERSYSRFPQKAYAVYGRARLYTTQANRWKTEKNEAYRTRYTEAHRLCSQLIAVDSGSTISGYAKELQREIECPSVRLTLEPVQYPGLPALALVQYRNTGRVMLEFYKVPESYAYQNRFQGIRYSDFVDMEVFRKQEVELPLHSDYQESSAEIKINELPQGLYAVIALGTSDNGGKVEFLSGALLQVSPITMVTRRDRASNLMMVVDGRSGEPLNKAKIEFYSRHWSGGGYNDRLVFTDDTGEDGKAVQNRTSDYSFSKAIVTHKGNRLVLFDLHHYYWWGDYEYRERREVFFTDRSIYRPGQTVYYKALLFRSDNDGDNKLVPGISHNVMLRDVNYRQIASHSLTTNEYGSVQGSFTIPQGLLNGQMYITSDYGSVMIQVEEYKRPTFEVKFDPVKQNYRFNDPVNVTGIARSLAGYAVDHSKVRYHVKRDVQYRYHWWWYPVIHEPSREIASGEAETDAKGAFSINFKAEADDIKNNNLWYNYIVTADITDVNGETRSAVLSLPVSNKPMLISCDIPEHIADRSKLTFPVTTTNLNGDFTPSDIEVAVTALQSSGKVLRERRWEAPDTVLLPRSEFEQYFPSDPYGNENNPATYAEKQKILTTGISVREKDSKDNRISLQEMAHAGAGWYRIDIKARNTEGVEIDETRYVRLSGDRIQKMEDWVTVVKKSGEPGEDAEFLVAGGDSRTRIYYEIYRNYKCIGQKSIYAGATPERVVIPIKEEYRGGIGVQFVMVRNGRTYQSMTEVEVPYSNKELDIRFITFRDKLLPGEAEKWTLSIKNKKGEKEAAEMVATLYDASLDQFEPHHWSDCSEFYPTRNHSYFRWLNNDAPVKTQYLSDQQYRAAVFSLPQVSLIQYGNYSRGLYLNGYYQRQYGNFAYGESYDLAFEEDARSEVSRDQMSKELEFSEASAPVPAGAIQQDMIPITRQDQSAVEPLPDKKVLTSIAARRNFNETAFFYPQLRTNAGGEIIIEFTVPEALTRWRMMGFAHTRDLKVGRVDNELITQKQVAISANPPRFFRENDMMEFTAKVNNITGHALDGNALLQLFDAATLQPIDVQMLKSEPTAAFDIKAGGSTGVKWSVTIPEGIQAVTYKVTAQAGNHTDGEEKIVPVMTNSMLVTETMPFSIRAGAQKSFTFDRLKQSSNTLRNHRLTLEFTSNPAWYAIQAMPYLMEYPWECIEQTFSRFYANSLSSTVVNSTPRVKQIFDSWRNIPDSKNVLLSNLEKNQELKQAMLEETPWVMQAKSETGRKKRVGLLFDLNRMSREQRRAFEKVEKAQQQDGGFGWFDGLPANRYMTQHIVIGIEHLKKLNALSPEYLPDAGVMTRNGLRYLDECIRSDYENLLENHKKEDLEKMQINYVHLHYLYACSFSGHKPADTKQMEAFRYYSGQVEKYWMEFNEYGQALAALTMHRSGNREIAGRIISSLKEYSQCTEEMGRYWNGNVTGYFWYQAPIETQALLIEAFNEASGDRQAVEEMKIWLLRRKQTTDWGTTKATAEACYALLMTGSNLLEDEHILDVKVGGKPLAEAAVEKIRPEAGTGYVKTSWSGNEISSGMGVIDVKNPNRHGIAWGGMYWQYFEQLDKITGAETNLKMNKRLFLKKNTQHGQVLEPVNEKNSLKIGDLVTVRMELRADRDFEYVHLKDMRAAGFEPVSTLSGYRHQDGLWYYESVKDASNNYFITYLRKGTYVFEYDLRVSHAGDFSNGITTFQCMYAPEFSAHSEGIRVKTE